MTGRRYTADDLAGLKAKIRALRSRTLDRGCSEAEAVAAAAKAAELMHGAGLTDELVDRPPFAEVELPMAAVRMKRPWSGLFVSIASVCTVQVWHGYAQGGSLVIFGFEPDVLIAEYLVEMLSRCVETERANFRLTDAYRRRRVARTRKQAVDAFLAGFIAALANKVRMLASDASVDEHQAKRAAVETEVARRDIQLRAKRQTKARDLSRHEAFGSGYAAGRAVPIHSGVGAEAARTGLPAPRLSLPAPGGRNA
ncbi:MAG TPA: DUF2786 domain-containing protein [Aliidongia sp.]|uniref:DUF7168 domain-containing protein n=1 Tax=Aliidongia sp. TaxID=1914230 RepID=UPI002DDD22BC|nr:DUF2786 domain-containing protein [Aliidongia sp.]HEV2675526.1 DUF2786 domain-containing protein [Aliidongia sp.]